MVRHDSTVASSGEPNRKRSPSDTEIIGQFGGQERDPSGEQDEVQEDSHERPREQPQMAANKKRGRRRSDPSGDEYTQGGGRYNLVDNEALTSFTGRGYHLIARGVQ